MPKRKHVNKVRVAPRTDANQGVREHIERVRKQNEYVARKLQEYHEKMEAERQRQQEAAAAEAAAAKPFDGYESSDPVNE